MSAIRSTNTAESFDVINDFLRNDHAEVAAWKRLLVDVARDKRNAGKPASGHADRFFREINTGHPTESRQLVGIPARTATYIEMSGRPTATDLTKLNTFSCVSVSIR